MKIAITATGKSPDAMIDTHFGRCSYFVIYDDVTEGIEFIPNPNRDLSENAGSASVEFLAARGVSKVVSAEFGQTIKELFDTFRIQLIIFREKETVSKIIQLLENARRN